MKAVAAIITDVHLDKGKTDLVKDVFNQLANVCWRLGVETVICAGDVFTSRSGQPLECLNAWQEILDTFANRNIVIIVIPGNHDKTDGDSYESYLDVYSGHPAMRLYRKSAYLDLDGLGVTLVPYFGANKWREELKALKVPKKDIMITHVAFNGVRNNDGTEVTDAVAPAEVKDWKRVLVGHYHNRSKVGKNIVYIGSAYQNNFGEDVNNKGFCILYNDASFVFQESHFPLYIKHTIKATDRETLQNLLEKYGEETNRKDHIRFEFVGRQADFQQIDFTDIQTRYGIDCKCRSEEEIQAIEESAGEEVLNYDTGAIVKDFYAFCAKNSIKGAKLKYGIGLIKMLRKNVESR